MWKARFTKNDIVPTLIKAAAIFVVVNDSEALAVDIRRTDFDLSPRESAARDAAILFGVIKQSVSGGGGSARLKGDTSGVQMDELGIGGQIQEFDRLRQQQQRRRRK